MTRGGTPGRLPAALAGLLAEVLACRAPAPPPPKELVDAALVIREMMRWPNLERVGFYDAYPEARPSDFVRFVSSERGAALWPPREGSPFAEELDLAQPSVIGLTAIPKGIAYRRNCTDPEGGRQIVYRADDSTGEVVVEAYADPADAPLLVERWKLPR